MGSLGTQFIIIFFFMASIITGNTQAYTVLKTARYALKVAAEKTFGHKPVAR